jgi:single-strand DNA-binding protein
LEKEVSYFDVETWAKLAESCKTVGRKGRGVRVVGRLKQNRWNSSDGAAHSRVTIVAENVEFRPDFKQGGSEKENSSGTYHSAPRNISEFPEIHRQEEVIQQAS